MHRFIVDCPEGMVVDHINHNTIDNRKSNLRIVTLSENQQNRKGATSNSTSGVLGVTWDNQQNKWRSHITIDKRIRWLGAFHDIEEAKKVTEKARAKYLPFSQERLKLGENVDYNLPSRKILEEQSGEAGVSYRKNSRGMKWALRMIINGKRRLVAYFSTAEEAELFKKILLPLNDENKLLEIKSLIEIRNSKPIASNKTSNERGIYYYPDQKKWRAFATIDKKQRSIGSFSTKEEAIKARNEILSC